MLSFLKWNIANISDRRYGANMPSLAGCPDVLHTVSVSSHVIRTQAGDVKTFTYLACVELLAAKGTQEWLTMVERVPIYTGFTTAGAVCGRGGGQGGV